MALCYFIRMFTLPRLHNLPIMKKYGFLFFLLLTSISLFAQANVRRTKTKGLIYTQEKTVNLSFNTSGFSFGYAKGKLKNYKVTPFWQFEFGRLKHPKSYKQVADITGNRNSKPYTYGKKNVFMTLRAMRGHKHYFSEKAKTKGVAVGMQYMAGLSLGLVKPYYLNIQRGVNPVDPTVGNITAEKYSEDNRAFFMDYHSIAGAASFFKGIKETKLLPGVHGRLGVLVDWGAFDETSKSVDAGVMIDVFPKAVPIMIDAKNYPFFLGLYLNFQFGKRS